MCYSSYSLGCFDVCYRGLGPSQISLDQRKPHQRWGFSTPRKTHAVFFNTLRKHVLKRNGGGRSKFGVFGTIVASLRGGMFFSDCAFVVAVWLLRIGGSLRGTEARCCNATLLVNLTSFSGDDGPLNSNDGQHCTGGGVPVGLQLSG